MDTSPLPPSTYLDFKGLASLKGQAHASRPEARPEAARQFESMFIQMMLKSMRAAAPRGELLESAAMDTYQDLFDKEVANQMGRRGALGIAAMLEKQLSRMPQPGTMPVAPGSPVAAPQATGPGLPIVRPADAPALLPSQKEPRPLTLPAAPGTGFPLSRTESAIGSLDHETRGGRAP